MNHQKINFACGLFLCFTLVALAYGQGFEGGIRIKLKAEPATVAVKQQKTVEQRAKSASRTGKGYTATTGALTVVSEPLATIYIQPVGATKFIDKEVLPATSSQAIFESLKPGKYKVVSELDGYVDSEKEIAIVPNKIQPLELRLQPELFTVTLKTNVPSGDVKYRLNKSGATPLFQRIEGGKAIIKNLRAGEYELDIKADDAAYKTVLATVDVGSGKTEFPVALEYALCEQVFSESWANLSAWEAPVGWQAANRKLMVKGKGLALPKLDCPRHFADFDLTTDVKLLNDEGLTLVLRAQNARNYYQIQLSGAKAAEPLLMKGTAVVNGVPQALGQPIPLDGFATNMTGKYFTVVLKARGNVFEVFINDSENGDELSLGKLIDPSKHFALGAVGIAGVGTEQNEVARFMVHPTKR